MARNHRIEPVTVEIMEWDGSRQSIDALCWWVNTQWAEWHPGEDPLLTFEFTGADDVNRPRFAQPDGDFENVQVGDWFVSDGEEVLLVRPTWRDPGT